MIDYDYQCNLFFYLDGFYNRKYMVLSREQIVSLFSR